MQTTSRKRGLGKRADLSGLTKEDPAAVDQDRRDLGSELQGRGSSYGIVGVVYRELNGERERAKSPETENPLSCGKAAVLGRAYENGMVLVGTSRQGEGSSTFYEGLQLTFVEETETPELDAKGPCEKNGEPRGRSRGAGGSTEVRDITGSEGLFERGQVGAASG